MMEQTNRFGLKENLAYGLFWSWNVIFLAFMVLGFAPRLLPDLITEVRNGTIPVNYLINGLVLSVIPLAATILGLTLLKRAPGRLFALGYVVEGPLMLVLVIRFFLIRQATPAFNYLMVVTWLGMAAFLWYALDPQVERRSRITGMFRLAGLTLMLLVSLYAAVWIAFYALPLGGAAVTWLVDVLKDLQGFMRELGRTIMSLFEGGFVWIFPTILGFILLVYTLALFALAPFAIPILSLRAWLRSLRDQINRSGRLAAGTIIGLTVITIGGLFFLFNRQPQKFAFELLQQPPATVQEAQSLLKQRESIRSGLLNAYLAPFRYISAVGEVRHVSTMYTDMLKLSAPAAKKVQKIYENVALPLLYQPVYPHEATSQRDNIALQEEPLQAARLYQDFFDTPITVGEREEIVSAVRSTWSATEAEAAWQAVDDREIRLVRQEINILEYGDWAEVELSEVYQNQTSENQEVVYYFNLPESAVITGVWLGNSPDREERYGYQIAPRGAAQAVYRNEVRRNIDPALVEQIGPRQYRLRAFPVPPKTFTWDEGGNRGITGDAPHFYLWLTYRTLAIDGVWQLPQLAIGRNVYWDKDTVRFVGGEPMQVDLLEWLPESVAATQPVVPASHRVDLVNGESVLITPISQASLPARPDDLRLAVVLDRSFSMENLREQVASTLARLEEITGQQPVDVYLTSSIYRAEAPALVALDEVDPEGILYFGGQNAAELLSQFADLSLNQVYDGVLILTDGSGYELGESDVELPAIDTPIWLVHLDSDIPLGYDDATLEAIQASGGGVVGDLDQALERLALGIADERAGASTNSLQRDLLDGYLWSVQPSELAASQTQDAILHTGQEDFAALAARQIILAEMRQQQGSMDNLETLDQLHALAQQYGIVTPYSSMIVLVNIQQQSLLNNLSENEDRFSREAEAIGETTPATTARLTGVPEPEEWLLLGLAAVLLAWYALRPRLALQRR
jgi:putative PEP-CTERM system integral membrane protein